MIDTHVHLFSDLDDCRFPLHHNAPYQPKVGFGPEQLKTLLPGAGIEAVVLVHPEPYQDDHRWLIHCLDELPQISRGICHFFPQNPRTPAQIRQIANDPRIVGVRLHAYAPERLPPLDWITLNSFWTAANEAGLLVQLHLEPRYADAFTPMLERFPQVSVVIDHCGRPLQGNLAEFEKVIAWSRFPQTFMKLSMLTPKDHYPHRDIGPFVRRLFDAFGPDRLLFGGTVPCTNPAEILAQKERLLRLLETVGTAEMMKIWGNNARKLFRFG
jgi:predicted TIM-barrel fold metal-dependent hydrolase